MWAGEVLTGSGPMTQLAAETGFPPALCYTATLALAASQFLLGYSPSQSWALHLDCSLCALLACHLPATRLLGPGALMRAWDEPTSLPHHPLVTRL